MDPLDDFYVALIMALPDEDLLNLPVDAGFADIARIRPDIYCRVLEEVRSVRSRPELARTHVTSSPGGED